MYTIISSFYNTYHNEQYKDKSYKQNKQSRRPIFKELEPKKKFKNLDESRQIEMNVIMKTK